ncbi:RidA family protein [Fulvivirga ulvae]|uniref:RidA family protein n=1 Tax=Fulvivirga ulvae TaxID=2904245 RepID=UPI001F2DC8BA|nr:RidA family protein [Fulvivirga ulvae]UII33716.1 RidA family protein [Fulvivirga ulvae]
MKKRLNISTGAPWEDIVGYSRAVRIGNTIEVSGTVAVRDGKLVGQDNPYEQTRCILQIIDDSIQKAGAQLSDVVRTRIFVTDIGQWQMIGKAHGEVFGDIKPATSMIEVSRLISPEYLLEIEATAIVQ